MQSVKRGGGEDGTWATHTVLGIHRESRGVAVAVLGVTHPISNTSSSMRCRFLSACGSTREHTRVACQGC